MFTIQSSRKFLLLILAIFALSSCAREPVTDVRTLKIATKSCFQASFSLAKSRYPNDLDKINETFGFEVFRCMTWKVVGSEAGPETEKKISATIKSQCPFEGLQSIVKDDFITCMEKAATPLVLERNPQQG
jgi:hypothetical protein